MAAARPIAVKALAHYRVWIRFEDGSEGEVDLSSLAGQGVFRAWLQPGFFEQVFVSEDAGTVTWPGELDLDPYVLYSKVTGKSLPGASSAA